MKYRIRIEENKTTGTVLFYPEAKPNIFLGWVGISKKYRTDEMFTTLDGRFFLEYKQAEEFINEFKNSLIKDKISNSYKYF